MKKFLIAVALCVGACARHRMESAMDSWIGQSQTELVSQWGAPDLTSVQPDSSKVLTWVKHHTESNPGQMPIPRECRQSFTVSPSGKITRWSTSGVC